MAYQNTDEILPIIDEAKTEVSNNKKQYGFAALMVLCLALTSFMAGSAYGSSSTASALRYGPPNYEQMQKCTDSMMAVLNDCDYDTYKCMLFSGYMNPNMEYCHPPDYPNSPMCSDTLSSSQDTCMTP